MDRDQIIHRLASSKGRRDQGPNKALAADVISSADFDAIEKLIDIIADQTLHINLTADALKVLEMIGEQQPKWIEKAFTPTLQLLESKQNKLVWRAMTIISLTSIFFPDKTFENLGMILKTMDSGTVITRDHGVSVLINLYQSNYQDEVKPLLIEQILRAPDNQLGQYAEKWMKIISKDDIHDLLRTLEQRQPDLTHPSHQKRIEKIVLKLYKRLK